MPSPSSFTVQLLEELSPGAIEADVYGCTMINRVPVPDGHAVAILDADDKILSTAATAVEAHEAACLALVRDLLARIRDS